MADTDRDRTTQSFKWVAASSPAHRDRVARIFVAEENNNSIKLGMWRETPATWAPTPRSKLLPLTAPGSVFSPFEAGQGGCSSVPLTRFKPFMYAMILVALALVAAGCATTPKDDETPASPTAEETLQLEVERLRIATEQPQATAQDFYELGNALFDLGQVHEALAAYAECVARDPQYGAAYCNIGLCYRRLGRIADAVAAYDRSLAVDPENVVTLSNAAVALELAGDWQRLVEIRAELVRLEPDSVRRHSDLGLSLVKAERYAEAAEAFETVLQLDPGYAGDYYNLGLCYFNLENWDRALTSWLTALAHNPQNEAVRRGLAVVYWKRGEYESAWKAVADCQSMGIRMDPEFIAKLQEDSGQLGPE